MNRIKLIIVAAVCSIFLVMGTMSAVAAEGTQEKCPVMGYTINKDLYTDYEGKRVYFCCASCPAAFEKDPEGYIKKMEEQGVTLEDAPK